MKTKEYHILIFLLSAIFMLGCNDYLDQSPKTQISASSVWKTEADVKMALIGCYGRFQNERGGGEFLSWQRSYLDCLVDNGYAQHYGNIRNVQAGTLTKSSTGVAGNLYSACYKGIASCNDFLAKFGNVELKPETAQYYEAQVKFLRAYFYNELVQRFGGVVVYTQIPDKLEDLFIPRSSEDDVYKLISEDLDYATSHLPDIAYSDGYAVKGSAIALKIRIALFRKQWNVVAELAKELITPQNGEPIYRLAEDLESPFIDGKGQDNCPEIMFSVKYQSSVSGKQDGGAEMEFTRWQGITPMDDLMNLYNKEKDKRFKEWYFKPVNKSFYERPNGELFNMGGSFPTDWGLFKFFAKDDEERFDTNERNIKTGNDAVLFRFTDILLMYAEAMVEIGGGSTSDALALKCINDIRERAGLESLSSPLTRDAVRLERRLELAFEGLRHFDIVRWGIGEQINGKSIYDNRVVVWESHFNLWPFSQSEEDINTHLKGNNNPGY